MENKMVKFTGYQKGELEGKPTFKCWFTVIDLKGFTTTRVKYLNEEDFKKLPKVGEEIKK